MGELALVERIRARAKGLPGGAGVALGIGDDCALLRVKAGDELAVTTDLSIEGQHFRLDWHTPEAVGHRALARGLSDLAAMGARPVAAFLSLGLPGKLTVGKRGRPAWVDRFLDGLLALATEHRVALAGGDVSESPVAMMDIVLTGAVPRGRALVRSGAQVGDRICVTGTLGGAAAELAALAAAPKRFQRRTSAEMGGAHLFPQARIPQGLALMRRALASSAMDLSDGLSLDLARLCRESGVAAELDAALIPVAEGATLEQALNGGEDYELLFTAGEQVRLPGTIGGVPLTVVGRVVAAKRGRPLVALRRSGKSEALDARGWEHFAGETS
jgi:thiamine-monophosphate kinase